MNNDVTRVLASSLILPKLDYCNCLLSNVTKSVLRPLQVAQNDAARLIFRQSRISSATSLLKELHWLPVDKRIMYKVFCIVFNSLHSCSPLYISELIKVYQPTRNLRSTTDNLLVRPMTSRKIGQQSFAFSAPQYWNVLPKYIRNSPSIATFKKRLKTFLFAY